MLGAVINYVVMNYIVNTHRELLANGNGNSFWSGVVVQSYNTKAASWALASDMYKFGARYDMVPIGMALGAAAVLVHYLIYRVSQNRLIFLRKIPTNHVLQACTESRQVRFIRHQLAPVHSIRWLYSGLAADG